MQCVCAPMSLNLIARLQLLSSTHSPVFDGRQYPEELLAFVLQKTRERLEKKGVDIKLIQDICTGTVLMELGGAKSGRLAAVHAGMPIEHAY